MICLAQAGSPGFLGIADKNQGAAGGFRNAGWVERSDDFDAVAKARHAAIAIAEAEDADAVEAGRRHSRRIPHGRGR